MTKYIFHIDGMRCGMCEAHVNDAVRRVAGVKSVKSSHARGETVVIAREGAEELLRAAVEAQGYRVLDEAHGPYEKRGLFARFKK